MYDLGNNRAWDCVYDTKEADVNSNSSGGHYDNIGSFCAVEYTYKKY